MAFEDSLTGGVGVGHNTGRLERGWGPLSVTCVGTGLTHILSGATVNNIAVQHAIDPGGDPGGYDIPRVKFLV